MIHNGSCHCGAVTFTVDTVIEKVIECNCTHCARKGLILTFAPRAQFTLITGENNLTEYRFNKERIAHQFCKTCGVQTFAFAANKDGQPTASINIRCLPDVDRDTLTIEKVDGKNY